ncbi:MAG TPA: putative hydro-lyase [Gemmatimonadaceae bacterium]|nr:putative hydro-lyase [Gemmatimonadaceae bacterium]
MTAALSTPGSRPPELAASSTPREVRLAARAGRLTGHTAGLANGYVQGNLVILPADVADDFLRFCELNPKPCPIIGVSDPGRPHVPALGDDIDLRTDLPAYRVWRHGEIAAEPTDISGEWRDDLVAFVLGCSFSFEQALAAEGIPLKHVRAGTTVPMYRTNVDCQPAGPFAGPLVVSMRPFVAADAIRAIEITSRFPAVHGAPVHLGDPAQLGIRDLSTPDYGEPVEIGAAELPVFWACGVTPQAAIAKARLPFAITHAPGCMLVTDVSNGSLQNRQRANVG